MPTAKPASHAAIGLSITPNTTPMKEAGATEVTSAKSQEYKKMLMVRIAMKNSLITAVQLQPQLVTPTLTSTIRTVNGVKIMTSALSQEQQPMLTEKIAVIISLISVVILQPSVITPTLTSTIRAVIGAKDLTNAQCQAKNRTLMVKTAQPLSNGVAVKPILTDTTIIQPKSGAQTEISAIPQAQPKMLTLTAAPRLAVRKHSNKNTSTQ